jgi:uncharacterized membrane protein YidH (DUF202 family)
MINRDDGPPPGDDPVADNGGPTDPPPGLDAGLVVERTRLAWRRTLLGLLAVALLLVRVALHRGVAALVLVGLALFLGAVVLGVTYRRRLGHTVGRFRSASPIIPVTALTSVGFATLGVFLVLLPRR